MLLIYNIGVIIYELLLRLLSPFNAKAKLFIDGRKNLFLAMRKKIDANDQPIWFHFASLGEFEQGRPVLEAIKFANKEQKIIVTFFSPSGYEIRKNYALADVFYLPLDTKKNAKKFIEIVNPKYAVFTKYEFWHHYFKTLQQKEIPLYLISGIFRPSQVFFKWYGSFYRNILSCVTHFFVQNDQSMQLLKNIGFTNASLSGDTRFDRVFENAQQPKSITEISAFLDEKPIFIAGSTWPDDEKILIKLAAKNPDWKLIIAPHEIGDTHMAEIENLFPDAIKFSNLKAEMARNSSFKATAKVLIIDNIGLLSALYQYANVAYIGGGFGVGIHNTLEAAAFGLPVIFGPKYEKFQEAKDLIAIGAAKSITSADELLIAFNNFKHNDKASADAKNYVTAKKGATKMIIKFIENN